MATPDLSRLTVGYSSLAHRLSSIPGADALAGAELVVVAQTGRRAGEEPSALNADALAEVARLEASGARVVVLDSRGVAKSRNEVLRQASRPYVLFADDDVTVDLEGVAAVVDHLAETGAALALGRAVDEHGEFRKNYVTEVAPLTILNSAKAATYEMVADVAKSTEADVWFDERFGAGVDMYLGDEYIYIADLLRAGLRCDAVPVTVAMHPADSSGSRWGTDADIDARSAALSRALGSKAWWVKPLFAARHFRTLGPRGFVRFLRPVRLG